MRARSHAPSPAHPARKTPALDSLPKRMAGCVTNTPRNAHVQPRTQALSPAHLACKHPACSAQHVRPWHLWFQRGLTFEEVRVHGHEPGGCALSPAHMQALSMQYPACKTLALVVPAWAHLQRHPGAWP